MGLGYADAVVPAWSERLQLAPEAVALLLSRQPALLEITPVTVKARLESLAALLALPLEATVQLVLRHPALAVVPPNATITRVKNLSGQLGVSMQRAGAPRRASRPLPRRGEGGAGRARNRGATAPESHAPRV